MMPIRLQSFCLALLVVLASCNDDVPVNNEANKPVVQAYLYPGQPVSVEITRQVPTGTSAVNLGIADLAVQIQHGSTSYTLTHVGNGIYQAPASLIPATGETYRLSFFYNETEVTAETTIPGAPVGYELSDDELEVPDLDGGGGLGGGPPEPLEATWSNPNREYHVVTLKEMDVNPRLIDEDEDEDSEDDDDEDLGPNQIGSPTRGTSFSINPQQFTYYGRHAIVLSRVQPEYATLFEDAGTQQTTLRSPRTNVVNGYGIFTGVHSDTLYIQVK